nr:hypothetical protein [Hyphomicrobiales bacterium]
AVSDARWFEVDADFGSAVRHFRQSMALFQMGGFTSPGLQGYQASMALMHARQSAHTSLEAGLLRILEMLGEERPVGEDWHSALIWRAAADFPGRPAILSGPVAKAADETRRFRHRATHNYDSFRIAEISRTLQAAEVLVAELPGQLTAFRTAIEPTPDWIGA